MRFLAFLLIAQSCFAGYTHRVSVTFNHLKVPSTQTDFPVFVCANGAASTNCDSSAHSNLSVPNLKVTGSGGAVTSSNGYDIGLFSDAGCTTALSYELDYYLGTSGALILWAKIPSLSSSVDTVEYLCFANSAITTNQSTTATWDNHFLTVFHFPNGTTVSLADSTSHANNGAASGGGTAQADPGQIDGSLEMISNGVDAFSSSGFPSGTADRTISFWFGITPAGGGSLTGSAYIAFYGLEGTNDQAQGFFIDRVCLNCCGAGSAFNGAKFRYVGWNDELEGNTQICPTGADTAMTHVMFQFTNSSKLAAIYTNGVFDNSATKSSWNTTLGTKGATIGGANDSGIFLGACVQCRVDDFRVSDSLRSVDWNTSEYNNGSSPSTFFTLGSDTPVGGTIRHRVIR